MMISKIYYPVVFLIILFQNVYCLIRNPAIGILTDRNIYVTRIIEFNYTDDGKHLLYHHNDPVYPLQSFTFNDLINRIYVCSPNTIYTLDLLVGSIVIPFSPVDDTPCLSSLTYINGKATLVWALRHSIVKLDFEDMSKEHLWNSTSIITHMVHNKTKVADTDHFYLSLSRTDRESSILYCRSSIFHRTSSFESCNFVDSGYKDVSALAIHKNILYIADRMEHKIYALTLLPNGYIVSKDLLPLNSSTVADIQSMFIHDNYLVWLTRSGHVRIVSLTTYNVRYLYWFDESLRAIELISYNQWPNYTTTHHTTTETYSTSANITSTISTTLQSDTKTTTKYDNNNNYGPWKATTYVTSVILGVALFFCSTMITCILLNYRMGRVVPHSFTNIFHILRRRTITTQSIVQTSEETLA